MMNVKTKEFLPIASDLEVAATKDVSAANKDRSKCSQMGFVVLGAMLLAFCASQLYDGRGSVRSDAGSHLPTSRRLDGIAGNVEPVSRSEIAMSYEEFVEHIKVHCPECHVAPDFFGEYKDAIDVKPVSDPPMANAEAAEKAAAQALEQATKRAKDGQEALANAKSNKQNAQNFVEEKYIALNEKQEALRKREDALEDAKHEYDDADVDRDTEVNIVKDDIADAKQHLARLMDEKKQFFDHEENHYVEEPEECEDLEERKLEKEEVRECEDLILDILDSQERISWLEETTLPQAELEAKQLKEYWAEQVEATQKLHDADEKAQERALEELHLAKEKAEAAIKTLGEAAFDVAVAEAALAKAEAEAKAAAEAAKEAKAKTEAAADAAKRKAEQEAAGQLPSCVGPAECMGKSKNVCKRMQKQEGKCTWTGNFHGCAGSAECFGKTESICKRMMEKEGKCQWITKATTKVLPTCSSLKGERTDLRDSKKFCWHFKGEESSCQKSYLDSSSRGFIRLCKFDPTTSKCKGDKLFCEPEPAEPEQGLT
eukprot:gnl/MRDRNA2_/MRDRNA2_89805_c0_seq1.p1 gnl/MRDRNA2_/MRDRNA2_89805_c0~~gnl/MRDRNA2_/MRDRNA2_89805_c0_seq1.p1  ORF type:complete len:543 (+),score=177.00 gnl/MRDRNA2_/MRDRNA2_89805_c0_seq1:89-1717(+)